MTSSVQKINDEISTNQMINRTLRTALVIIF